MLTILKREIQFYEKRKLRRISSIGYPMKSIILYILNATFLSSKRIKQNVLVNNPLNEKQFSKLLQFLDKSKTAKPSYCKYGCELLTTHRAKELRDFGIGVTTYNGKYCNEDDLKKQLAMKSAYQILSPTI